MSIYWALALWVSGVAVGMLLAGLLGKREEPPNPRVLRSEPEPYAEN